MSRLNWTVCGIAPSGAGGSVCAFAISTTNNGPSAMHSQRRARILWRSRGVIPTPENADPDRDDYAARLTSGGGKTLLNGGRHRTQRKRRKIRLPITGGLAHELSTMWERYRGRLDLLSTLRRDTK